MISATSKLLLRNKDGTGPTMAWKRVIAAGLVASMLSFVWSMSHSGPSLPAAESAKQNDSTNLLCYRQSYGFFDSIPDREWIELYQAPARNARYYASSGDPNRGTDQAALWIFANQDPTFACPAVRKVGGLGDGAKWICDPHRLNRVAATRESLRETSGMKSTQDSASRVRSPAKSDCLIYLIGSNGNFLFEDSLFQTTHGACEIHVFDMGPYPRSWADMKVKNIYYHQWGLKSSYNTYNPPSGAALSFSGIQRLLGHQNRTIDILKIDCDGCEWSTYQDWLSNNVDIRQILIETHDLPRTNDGVYNYSATTYFDRLRELGYIMFYKEITAPPGDARLAAKWSYLKLHGSFWSDDVPTPTVVYNV